MSETVVIVRCQWCMTEHRRWDSEVGLVFVASTLKKYAEMVCENCVDTGMEIYVGKDPANERTIGTPEEAQAVADSLSIEEEEEIYDDTPVPNNNLYGNPYR